MQVLQWREASDLWSWLMSLGSWHCGTMHHCATISCLDDTDFIAQMFLGPGIISILFLHLKFTMTATICPAAVSKFSLAWFLGLPALRAESQAGPDTMKSGQLSSSEEPQIFRWAPLNLKPKSSGREWGELEHWTAESYNVRVQVGHNI